MKLTLHPYRALETTNDEGGCSRKDSAEWDAEEKKNGKGWKNDESKSQRLPLLLKERNQMMNFLLKDSFKDFIPMGSEKEREMLKEREAKRLLRKRKATISEELPFKEA
ncbi:hypothetical protein Tco_0792611 [Tanacetum coccineum]